MKNAFEQATEQATKELAVAELVKNSLVEDSIKKEVAKHQLDGARHLVAHIIDLVQESIQTDGDFMNTIDRERSPQQWQYFDGYISARKLDLDHLYRLRDFMKESD